MNETSLSLKKLGYFLLFIVFFNLFLKGISFSELIWFCDIATIILGISLIRQNKYFTSMILILSIPAQFLWIFDFFLEIFGFGFGRTSAIFGSNFLNIFITSVMHGILIPSAIYGTCKLGFEKKAYFGSALFLSLLLLVSFLFTTPFYNTNCAFFECDLKIDNTIGHEDRSYYTFYFIKNIFEWIIYITFNYFIIINFIKYRLKYYKKNEK